MKYLNKIFVLLLLCFYQLFSQTDIRIMNYNLLNYPGSDPTARNPSFKTVIEHVNPDILVVQELSQPEGINIFLEQVLNSTTSYYSKGTFIDGPDSDNGIYYKTSKFNFLSNTPIHTALRDINEFKLEDKTFGNIFYIYAVHLKASTGTDNEAARAAEVDLLRAVTNALPTGSEIIVTGDFNIYKSGEQAYIKLLFDNPGDDGNFLDPIIMPYPTLWNNVANAPYHTQSSRGSTSGGLDDRFDMILFSNAITVSPGIRYKPNSTTPVGNDGQHYNLAVNELPVNTSVPENVANALVTASDHLPVYADFVFDVLPVELVSFTATQLTGAIKLEWKTATEKNNYGFDILKKADATNWQKIGFVNGNGNSNSPKEYLFYDSVKYGKMLFYKLKQIDFDGSFEFSDEISVETENNKFIYSRNYPNPFNPETVIEFSLPFDSFVNVVVYNSLGEKIEVLINELRKSGKNLVNFNAKNLSTGVYFYQITAVDNLSNNIMTTKNRMVYIK